MAHRRAIDRVRAAQASHDREERVAVRDHQPAYDEVAEAVVTRLEQEQVRRCLESLTDLQRESVTLAYYGGYSYSEVAGLLDVPLGTVKTRMRDGLDPAARLPGGDRVTEQVPSHEMHLLTGAYAADALDAGERDAFEVHLETCDACRQEVAELTATTARLGSAEAVPPPPGLRARVLDEIARTRQLPPGGWRRATWRPAARGGTGSRWPPRPLCCSSSPSVSVGSPSSSTGVPTGRASVSSRSPL